MLKKNITFALMFFVVYTSKDLFFNEKIQWNENILLSIIMFVIFGLWEWAKEPYDWNKNKNKKSR